MRNFQLSVTPQAAVVDNSNDTLTKTVNPPGDVKPLRSALRSSTEPKHVAAPNNDLPSKSSAAAAKTSTNKSPTTPTGRKVEQQRIETSGALSDGGGGPTLDGSTGGVGTTLSDLKRQRAQTRRSPEGSPAPSAASSASVGKSTTVGVGVGNGDVSSPEPRLRLTSPEYVTLEQKRERTCCVIF